MAVDLCEITNDVIKRLAICDQGSHILYSFLTIKDEDIQIWKEPNCLKPEDYDVLVACFQTTAKTQTEVIFNKGVVSSSLYRNGELMVKLEFELYTNGEEFWLYVEPVQTELRNHKYFGGKRSKLTIQEQWKEAVDYVNKSAESE